MAALDAMHGSHAEGLREAMAKELQSLAEQSRVWCV